MLYHPLLHKQLRKNGRRAFATVVELKRTHWLNTAGDPSLVSSTERMWKFVVRVEPDDEEPFEGRFDAWLGQLTEPEVGTRWPVLYDPDDRSKIMLDDSEEGAKALTDAAARERTDGQIARMRSRGQNEMADRYQQVVDQGLTTQWSTDPVERRAQIQERREKIKEIMAGQGAGGQQRLQADAMATYGAQYEQLKRTFAPPTVLVGGEAVQPGEAAATADALTKLADLHDRGALTDEEFQAQKEKVLHG